MYEAVIFNREHREIGRTFTAVGFYRTLYVCDVIHRLWSAYDSNESQKK